MLVSRCAWHRMYHGYVKLLGVVSWQGWSLQFTDGMCRGCSQRLRADWRRGRGLHDRIERSRRRATLVPLPLSAGVVAVPVLTALVLAAGPLHDGSLLDGRGVMPSAAAVRRASAPA